MTPACYFIPIGIAGTSHRPLPVPLAKHQEGEGAVGQGAPGRGQGLGVRFLQGSSEARRRSTTPARFSRWVQRHPQARQPGHLLDDDRQRARRTPTPVRRASSSTSPIQPTSCLLIDARNIHPVNSDNFGNVDDPHIQSTLERLEAVPAAQPDVRCRASGPALDEYATQHADYIVWGSNELIKFLSDRINFKTAVFQPLFFNDYSTWQLNS